MGITKITIDKVLGHRGFYEVYGIDLEQEATKLAVEWLL